MTLFVVWSALDRHAHAGHDDAVHRRREVSAPDARTLQVANAVNGATIAEKNLILAEEKSEHDVFEKQFHERIAEARTAADQLIAMSDTPAT